MSKRKRNGHNRGFIGYGSYMFRDKAPSIDETRTLIMDEYGVTKITRKVLTSIHNNGGPSVAAMDNWFNGDTMRPQDPSLEACGRAMGYFRKWVKMPSEMKEERERMMVRHQRLLKQLDRS